MTLTGTALPSDGYRRVEIPALDVRHLSAGYNGKLALEDVSLSVRAGERIGLIGPNGAGKSTLFRAIVGLLPPRRGEIFINGRTDREARREAAFVPQFEDVDWEFPVVVIDVVEMGLARQIGWFRFPNARHWAIAREALARVGMADYAGTQIGELSGGQKRRVFIARALAQGAHILLMDEPFSGVDAVAQMQIMSILDDLRSDGVTIILATHDLNLAASHFDRLLILNTRVFAYGPPDEVFKPEILAPAFGGQIAVWHREGEVVMLTDQHT
ncbi:MAG TPA: metal ABC transporter ATP-binding protein [Aggregatilineales bacterium]|nr:metal ABC transporter ATP-binding protein [Aggregatilineales bacterium]